MAKKPYSVWMLQQGKWECCFETHDSIAAKDYAHGHICHAGRPRSAERIEIRDLTGVLETVWDRSWK